MSTVSKMQVQQLVAEERFLQALARSLLGDDEAARDVAQEACLQAMRRPPEGSGSLRSWLAVVVRNLARNRQRGEARREHHERAAAARIPKPEELLAQQELRRQVVELVTELPEIYRDALLLRYFEGLPPRRIAHSLGIPRATVATRLKRGLAMLRERLDVQHGGDRRSWMLGLAPLLQPSSKAAAVLISEVMGTGGVLLAMKTTISIAVVLVAVFVGISFLGGDEAPGALPRGVGELPAVAGGSTIADGQGTPTPIETAPFEAPAGDASSTSDESREAASVLAALGGITGRLVLLDGSPAADERVRVLGFDPVVSLGGVGDPTRPGASDAGIAVREARSDADGRFRVTGIWPGSLLALHAGIGGRRPTFLPLETAPGPAETVDLGTITLTPLRGLRGRVVAEDGVAIAGAEVWTIDVPAPLFAMAPLDRLRPGGPLFVALPDLGDLEDLGGEEAHRRIKRQLMSRIPAAEPDAAFAVLELPRAARRVLEVAPRAITTTAEDGSFELMGLPSGASTLVVSAPGCDSVIRPSGRVREGELRDVGTISLGRGLVLSGIVIDAEGQPVADTEVVAASRPAFGLTGVLFGSAPVRTAVDGSFEIAGLPPTEELIVAARRERDRPWTLHGPIDPYDELTLALDEGGRLEIAVTSAQRRHLQSLRLRVLPSPPLGELHLAGFVPAVDLPASAVETKETLDGVQRLTVTGLARGIYSLWIEAADHAPAYTVVRVEGPEPTRTEVTLRPALACTVQVHDHRGQPVQGARIYVEEREAAAWSRALSPSYAGLHRWRNLAIAAGRTDAEGRLALPDLPPAPATITARHPAWGCASVSLSEPQQTIELVMEQPGAITGQIFAHGVPASPQQHRLIVTGERDREASGPPAVPRPVALDAAGRFRVTGLRPGRYVVALAAPVEPFTGLGVFFKELTRIRVFDPSQRSETIDVGPGETVELVFDLDPDRLIPGTEGTSVAGRITIDGEPARGLRILYEPSNVDQRTHTDASGYFRIDGFPPREVTFRVLEGPGESRKLWQHTLRLPAGGILPLEIDLEMVVLQLRVRTAAGSPAPDHEVVILGSYPDGASFLLSALTDGAGALRTSIPAAPATASIQGPLGTAACPLQPHADEPLQVAATLATPGVISGRIISTPGGITPRCVVFNRASDDSPVAWTLVRGEEFRFHQANLEPGRYELSILDADLEEYEAVPRFFDLPAHEGLLDQVLRVGAPR